MNILVLQPTLRYLRYDLMGPGGHSALCQGRVPNYRASDNGLAALNDIGGWCAAAAGEATASEAIHAVAICAPYGGERFAGPVQVSDTVLESLRSLEEEAPLHVPLTLAVAEAVRRALPDAPSVLVFGTAFFTALPPRERSYAVDPAIMGRHAPPRRYGVHGLYHEAASRFLRDRLRESGAAAHGRRRIVSVCLEACSEVAAVLGHLPAMVTGGATPLEGLPGDTICGELDPQIPILLAQRLGWGEEETNRVLTRESGLAGLAAPGETLLSLFHGEGSAFADASEFRLAREVVRYRFLQACGAAVAALGGADGLVFSGRYLGAAAALGPWLSERLGPRGVHGRTPLPWVRFGKPLERIAAEAAALVLCRFVPVAA